MNSYRFVQAPANIICIPMGLGELQDLPYFSKQKYWRIFFAGLRVLFCVSGIFLVCVAAETP